MNRYTLVIDPSGRELTVVADTEKQAHRQAWNMLTPDEQNAAASLEIVESVRLG